MQEAYIVAYGRSAAAKAKQGALFHERPDDVAAKVLQGVLKRIDGKFNKNMIEDVIVGRLFQKDYKDKTLHERLHCVRDYLTRYRVKQ